MLYSLYLKTCTTQKHLAHEPNLNEEKNMLSIQTKAIIYKDIQAKLRMFKINYSRIKIT